MYKCIISALVLIYDFKNSAKLTVSSVADKKKLNKKTIINFPTGFISFLKSPLVTRKRLMKPVGRSK